MLGYYRGFAAEALGTTQSNKVRITMKIMSILTVDHYLVTHASKAGDVQWNFEKFLVDRHGQVVGRYSSQVTPSDGELIKAIDQALAAKAH